MLGIRVGKEVVCLASTFPKALLYVSVLVEQGINAHIDSNIPDSFIDRTEYLQQKMDSLMREVSVP